MREIKFRGKKIDGEWYFGDLIKEIREFNRTCDKAYILPYWDTLNGPISVDKKSVGEYTGARGKNGFEIYEGDVFQYTIEHEFYIPGNGHSITTTKHRAVVEFSLGSFMLGDEYLGDCLEYDDSLEYIGNIYENPELLKEQTT